LAARGTSGLIGGLALAPLTFLAAPFYALVVSGRWAPVVLQNLGSIVALALLLSGESHLIPLPRRVVRRLRFSARADARAQVGREALDAQIA
jgi:hypothetical protein